MTTISFLSSINYQRDTSIDEKIISSLSDYFYLGGVQVKVVKGNEVRLEEGKVSWFTLALKVASYVLLLPLTCILFAIYQGLRSQYNFTPVVLPKPDTAPQVSKKPEQEKPIELTVTSEPSKEIELPKSVQPESVKPNKATSSTSASSACNSQSPLLTQGKFRLNQDQNEPPNFTSICDAIDSEMLWSAAFACCFHTSESFNEIWALIKKCNINERNKIQPCHPIFALPPRTEIAVESGVRFYNNLCHLHDNMPGDTKLKSAKIYWNDRVEEILFPLFFNNDNVNIDDLIFIITPGEGVVSIDQGNTPGKAPYPYQAEKMVFTRQLQFVGTGKAKIFEYLKNDIEILAKKVQGATIKAKEQVTEETNALMADAEYYTYLCNLHSELLSKL